VPEDAVFFRLLIY